MLSTIIFGVSKLDWSLVRSLLLGLLVTALLAGVVVFVAMLAPIVWAAVAAFLGKLLAGLGLTAGYAWWFRP